MEMWMHNIINCIYKVPSIQSFIAATTLPGLPMSKMHRNEYCFCFNTLLNSDGDLTLNSFTYTHTHRHRQAIFLFYFLSN